MSASAVVGPAHHYYSSATAKLSETRCRGNHSPKRHLSEINSQLLKLTLRPTHRGGLAHLIWNQAQLFSSKVSFASSQEELRDATPAGSAAESPKAGLKDTVKRSRCQLSESSALKSTNARHSYAPERHLFCPENQDRRNFCRPYTACEAIRSDERR